MSDAWTHINALQRACGKAAISNREGESETNRRSDLEQKGKYCAKHVRRTQTQTGASFLASSPLERAI